MLKDSFETNWRQTGKKVFNSSSANGVIHKVSSIDGVVKKES